MAVDDAGRRAGRGRGDRDRARDRSRRDRQGLRGRRPGWIAVVAGRRAADLSGVHARLPLGRRRSTAMRPLSLPIVTRIVVAGFGPFALGGGFGVDKRALEAIDEDERSARVRVMALGHARVGGARADGLRHRDRAARRRARTSCRRCCGRGRLAVPLGSRSRCGRAGRAAKRLAQDRRSGSRLVARCSRGSTVFADADHATRARYFGAWLGTTRLLGSPTWPLSARRCAPSGSSWAPAS